MITKNLTRTAGILTLIAFFLSLYIGFDDTVLKSYQPTHWELNWILTLASLVAAISLILFPRSTSLVFLAGIAWPVAYASSIVVDIYTRLCLGGIQANCWPSRMAAFDYLILNERAQGWVLFPGTTLSILALLFVSFLISVVTIYSLWKNNSKGVQKELPPSANVS